MYELHKKAAEKSAFRSPTPSQFPQKCRGIVANVPVPLLASHIRKCYSDRKVFSRVRKMRYQPDYSFGSELWEEYNRLSRNCPHTPCLN